MKKFMFALLLVGVLALTNLGLAQISANQDVVTYEADVVTNPLAITQSGGVVYSGLRAGTCYTAPADPTGAGNLITPFTGAEAVAQTDVQVTGDPFANVMVVLSLPTQLIPSGGIGNVVTMSYDGSSGAWQEDGGSQVVFFNPQNSHTTMNLGGAGLLHIWLSGNPCTPANAEQDAYTNNGLITVAYQ
jgi:hypothetical protein